MGRGEISLAAQPRQGDIPDVPQGSEESEEEENLGGDEPKHALTKGAIDLSIVAITEVLGYDIAKPAVEEHHEQRKTG